MLNAWGNYTVGDLYTFLSDYSLPYAPGTKWVYSDTGVGLLGLGLSLFAAGGTYEENIRSVVVRPLGLVDTTVTLSASQAQRFAQGYDGDLNPTEPWTFTEAMAGMGALRSTANDLLVYAAAQAGLVRTRLSDAMTLSHVPIHPTTLPGFDVGINWLVSTGGDLIWHNGGVLGGTAFVGFDPLTKKAAVVLADTGDLNTMTTLGVDPVTAIGLLLVQWLEGTRPPPLTSILPPAVHLTTREMGAFVGTYVLAGAAGTFTITMQGGRLVATDATLWPRPIVLYPTTSSSFVCREVLASLEFSVGTGGLVDGVSIAIDGQTISAAKE